MNYYEEIKNELVNNEIYKKTKDYSKNKSDLNTYYNVGKLLIEAQGGEERAKYGDGLIKEYSEKLTKELGKRYEGTTLKRMRKFYLIIQKGAHLAHQLSWSHYQALLSLKNIDEINYYINLCISLSIGRNELRNKIKLKEYERLSEEAKTKLINQDRLEIKDMIKNPIVIKNKYDTDKISEKMLHNLVIEDIESFMKELGSGYAFIGSEYKIKIGNSYNYIEYIII